MIVVQKNDNVLPPTRTETVVIVCVDGIDVCHNKECKLDCAFEPNQEHCCECMTIPGVIEMKACIVEGARCCDPITQDWLSQGDGSCVSRKGNVVQVKIVQIAIFDVRIQIHPREVHRNVI